MRRTVREMLFIFFTLAYLSFSDAFVARNHVLIPNRSPKGCRATTCIEATATKKIDLQRENWAVLPDIFESLSKQIPDVGCLEDSLVGADGTVKLNYQDVNNRIKTLAAGLQSKNLRSGECIALFAENSHKWFLLDQAIMKCGAHSAVRGASAPPKELAYIYENSNCTGLAVENLKTLQTLISTGFLNNSKAELGPKFVIVLHGAGQSGQELKRSLLAGAATESFLHHIEVLTFNELLEHGMQCEYAPVEKDPSSTATIVYTSGTTSHPKGVVLSHKNLVSQARDNSFNRAGDREFDPSIGDSFLSLLPCWHIFERSAEYGMLAHGCRIVYSNLPHFKKDLEEKKPQYLIAVPRLYESLHKSILSTFQAQSKVKRSIVNAATVVSAGYTQARDVAKGLVVADKQPSVVAKFLALLQMTLLWPLWKLADALVWSAVREKFGGKLKAMISGGALLPPHIEKFFALTGLNLIAGYGLTETSPVICNQLVEHKVLGCIGPPSPGVEIKVLDPESGMQMLPGQTGILHVKGPGVMQGYINDPVSTAAVMDSEGYFNTGDLVRVNPATGDLIITGRFKDVIVLSNGENVAPEPIEDTIVATSNLVDQVMLIGQDKRCLKALVVLNIPNLLSRGCITAARAAALTDLLCGHSAVRAADSTPELKELLSSLQKEVKSVNEQLQKEAKIHQAIRDDLSQAMREFKPHERVNEFIFTVEPFSMSNGQLTQTLKVKRHKVLADYII